MTKTIISRLVLGMAATSLAISVCASNWPTSPLVNLPIATNPIQHLAPKAISDGTGGAIITWEDARFGTTLDQNVYAQRVRVDGVVMWTIDGEPVCDALGNQEDPQICSDGGAGSIIVWTDYRTGNADIYAQRVSAFGTAVWDSNGVAVCVDSTDQIQPQVVADGMGGAIITWTDARNTATAADIYAQRIDADGNSVWAANGVAVCTHVSDQNRPELTTDGNSGAIISWRDRRGPTFESIYAQRVDLNGVTKWASNGELVGEDAGGDRVHGVISHSFGGAIIAWSWEHPGRDILAQRLDPLGTALWDSSGVPVCTAGGNQGWPRLVSDGQSGAIVCWSDQRDGPPSDIYANRVSSSGNVIWATNGVRICVAGDVQSNPQLVADGTGGAIIAWEDSRSVPFEPDIYAQRVNANGDTLWQADGVEVSTAVDWQWMPQLISSGSGAAIITWQDDRPGGSENHVYAQGVGPSGNLGHVVTTARSDGPKFLNALHAAYPNPFNPTTTIRYSIKERGHVSLRVYNVAGQLVKTLVDEVQTPAQVKPIEWHGRNEAGKAVSSGVYFYKIVAKGFTQTRKMVLLK